MPSKKEDRLKWFADNLEAKLCNGAIPNCSACVFRDTKMCGKMTCTYVDDAADVLETVYWVSKKTNANVSLSPELVKYFVATSTCEIMDISKEVLTKAVSAEKRR